MSEDERISDADPPGDGESAVACTITESQAAARPKHVGETLSSTHRETAEHSDGYTYVFEAADGVLEALATFVSNEHRCCSFAHYTIGLEPPYDEVKLTITGPAGTKDVFDADLVERLAATHEGRNAEERQAQ